MGAHLVVRPLGFTLVELLVVLVVLATLAGVAVHAASNATAQATAGATSAQLSTLRESIVGVAGGATLPCFRGDCGGTPKTVADLLRLLPGQVCYVPYASGEVAVLPFDVTRRVGWRGPYVFVPRATYVVVPARGFTTAYGQDGDPAVVDAWGNPIVLQVPDPDLDPLTPRTDEDLMHARLVSAGEDGALQTPPDVHYPLVDACHDDLVLYLRVADLRQ